MDNNPNPNSFLEKYSLISSSNSFKEDFQGYKKCKFCKEEEPKVSFKNTPHIIPELLGANNFVYLNECDECNSTFSKYESHLAVFLRPYLTLNNVKGKKRTPEFHSRKDDKETITEIISTKEQEREMYFNQNMDDFEIDETNKVIHVTFRKSPFKPLSVYKALARVAVSLLPEFQMPFYEHVCKWLKSNNDEFINFFPHCFITIMTRRKFREPLALLYKANELVRSNEEYPDLALILGFANVVVQIFVPYSVEFDRVHSDERTLVAEVFPAFAWDDLKKKSMVKIASMDLSSTQTIKQDHKISMSFQELHKEM